MFVFFLGEDQVLEMKLASKKKLLVYFADNCGEETWKLDEYTNKGAMGMCRRAGVK